MPARAPARHHAPPALDTRSPFLRTDALAAGLTDKELAGPRFRRIFTAVYSGADVAPHPLHRVAAALLVHPPEAFASHASAARVLNAPLPRRWSGWQERCGHTGARACRSTCPRSGARTSR